MTFIPPHDRELRELKLILQLRSTCILSDAFHRNTEYMGNIDCCYAVSHGQQSKVTIKLGLIDSMTNGLPHWGWCFPGLQPGERSIVGPSALRFSPYACLALAYISSITSPPRPPTNWMSSTPVSSGSSAKDPSATGYQGGNARDGFRRNPIWGLISGRGRYMRAPCQPSVLIGGPTVEA